MSAVYRRYVDTSLGQIHVTEAGEGPAALLMHWVPLSGAMYRDELAHFVAAGFRPLAVEMAQPTRTATNKVRALVIDGGPLMPPEAFQTLLLRARVGSGPGLRDDGSHRNWLWDQAAHTYTLFAPQTFQLDETRLPRVYQFIGDFIAAGMRQDLAQLQPFDFAARLKAVRMPTLVLSAETEPLRASFEPLIDCRGECRSRLFPEDHPLHDPARAGEFARVVTSFYRSALTSRSTK